MTVRAAIRDSHGNRMPVITIQTQGSIPPGAAAAGIGQGQAVAAKRQRPRSSRTAKPENSSGTRVAAISGISTVRMSVSPS